MNYKFDEVRKILCEACAVGIPYYRRREHSIPSYHVINDERVPCYAARWIEKEGTGPEVRDPAYADIEKEEED